jgi:hypothetical protein
MDMCQRENLYQVDLLSPSEKKITEREYWASRRGQQDLDKKNQQMIDDGVTPRQSNFQTQKQYLRNAIDDAIQNAASLEDFQRILSVKYNITFKESRGRFSYLHPERNKYITGRSLGTHYEKEYLLQKIPENVQAEKSMPHQPKATEIALYEAARDFLKEKSSDGKLPSMKLLKEKRPFSELIL